MLKIFYSPLQSVEFNKSFSPSASKPKEVVNYWLRRYTDLEIVDFDPVTREDLKRVHNKFYVDGVLELTHENGFYNKSPEIAKSLPWVCGSMVEASLDAFRNKTICISPTSGAHHASFDLGQDFCTFNFLALAALKLKDIGAKRVGILDLDCHYGNGTADIIKKLKLSFITHYSFGEDPLIDINIKDWIRHLPEILSNFEDCDFIIYNAGVDSHKDDPLGGYLTTEEIKLRERIVFDFIRRMKIPMSVTLAGGYQKDSFGGISKVLELHSLMFEEAMRSI